MAEELVCKVYIAQYEEKEGVVSMPTMAVS